MDEVLEHPWLQEAMPKALPSIAMLRTPPKNELFKSSILTQTLKPLKLPFSGQNINQMILSPHKRFTENRVDKENQLNLFNNDRKRKVDLQSNIEKKMELLKLDENQTNTRTSSNVVKIPESSERSSKVINTSPTKRTNVMEKIEVLINNILDGNSNLEESEVTMKLYIKDFKDYSNKYGIAFIAHDNSFCAFFNDTSSICLAPDNVSVSYIERFANSDSIINFKIHDYPSELEKKVSLLKHFVKPLSQSPHYTPNKVVSKRDPSNFFYVKKWLKQPQATFFRLSNDILQVNFEDKSCVVLSTDNTNCLFRNKTGTETSFSLLRLSEQAESKSITHRLMFIRNTLANQKKN